MQETRFNRVYSDREIARFRRFTALHVWMYKVTGGVLGGRIKGIPVLLLTTIGRNSGRLHTTPLLGFADGDTFVIVGSAGGVKQPQWFLNLQKEPLAEIQVGRRKYRVRAREADEQEYNRLWPNLCKRFPHFASMQEQTSRKIPVVFLDREMY